MSPKLRRILVVVVSLSALGGAIGVEGACSIADDLGSYQACRPATVNGKLVVDASPDGAALPDPACSACLEGACCEAVGICERSSPCAETVFGVHACVLDAGRAALQAEERCSAPLDGSAGPEGKTYACMRARCGAACGLPSCALDPQAPLFFEASCDRCVTGSCCREVNDCFGNRSCKLAVECILDRCKPAATAFGAVAEVARASQAVCAGGAAAAPDPCIARCVESFARGADPLVPAPRRAECLALEVVACGASQCDPACASGPRDGGTD